VSDAPDWAAIWRKIIVGDQKSWVAFSEGTCVILMQPEEDLAAQAARLLAEWGPVHVATPSADFNVITLEGGGWVVTCHHPDILAYVFPEEAAMEMMAGLVGRQRRNEDSQKLLVAHVEDKRA
jgi:hypothetical protein